jgi:hypothetical protein
MNLVRARLPSLADLLRVASVVSIFLYGWTIVTWLWQLPSWMLSLNIGEILSAFAYVILSAFSETLTILTILLLLTALLPPRLMRDDFTVRGSWTAIGLLGSLLIFVTLFIKFSVVMMLYIIPWTVGALALAGLLAFLSSRVAFMRSVALWLSDRLMIFLYIFAALTVISFATVIARNLF